MDYGFIWVLAWGLVLVTASIVATLLSHNKTRRSFSILEHQINSNLKDQIAAAVKAAVLEGVSRGIEIERTRSESGVRENPELMITTQTQKSQREIK